MLAGISIFTKFYPSKRYPDSFFITNESILRIEMSLILWWVYQIQKVILHPEVDMLPSIQDIQISMRILAYKAFRIVIELL